MCEVDPEHSDMLLGVVVPSYIKIGEEEGPIAPSVVSTAVDSKGSSGDFRRGQRQGVACKNTHSKVGAGILELTPWRGTG